MKGFTLIPGESYEDYITRRYEYMDMLEAEQKKRDISIDSIDSIEKKYERSKKLEEFVIE